MGRIIRIFLSGVLALLPIMVTVIVTAWVGSLVVLWTVTTTLTVLRSAAGFTCTRRTKTGAVAIN